MADINVVALTGELVRTWVTGPERGRPLLRLLLKIESVEPYTRTDQLMVTYFKDSDNAVAWEDVRRIKWGQRVHITGRIARTQRRTDKGQMIWGNDIEAFAVRGIGTSDKDQHR